MNGTDRTSSGVSGVPRYLRRARGRFPNAHGAEVVIWRKEESSSFKEGIALEHMNGIFGYYTVCYSIQRGSCCCCSGDDA